jgi:hypothetical protein
VIDERFNKHQFNKLAYPYLGEVSRTIIIKKPPEKGGKPGAI